MMLQKICDSVSCAQESVETVAKQQGRGYSLSLF